jgi:hypothetical protein
VSAPKVDVLAVLDEAVCALQREGNDQEANDLIAATAAVAELVEAMEKIAKSSPEEGGCYYTNKANIRIAKAALANIGPQS